MKRIAATVAAAATAIALAGIGACTSIGRAAAPRAVVDFGPPVAALAPSVAWPGLAIEVRAPLWFDSPGIGYRLAYANPNELRDYAATRWAGAPSLLIAQRLRQRLQLAPAAATPCRVVVAVDEFSQIFDSPATSRGVLRGTATLGDRRGKVLARTVISAEVAAATADASGGVAALAAAVDGAAATLAAWLDDPSLNGGLKACAG